MAQATFSSDTLAKQARGKRKSKWCKMVEKYCAL